MQLILSQTWGVIYGYAFQPHFIKHFFMKYTFFAIFVPQKTDHLPLEIKHKT